MYINIYITCNNIYTFINQLLPQVSLHFRFLVGNSLVSPKFPPGQIKIGMAWRTWRNNIASVSFLDPQNGGNHHITPKARQSIHDTLYIHLVFYSPKSICCIASSFPAKKDNKFIKKKNSAQHLFWLYLSVLQLQVEHGPLLYDHCPLPNAKGWHRERSWHLSWLHKKMEEPRTCPKISQMESKKPDDAVWKQKGILLPKVFNMKVYEGLLH